MKMLYPFYIKKTFLVKNQLLSNSKKAFSEEAARQMSNDNKGKTSIFFNYGVTMLPHIEKRTKGGEDAYSVDEKILTVADGVGGWNEIGVDPSLYSKELVANVLKEYKNTPDAKTLDIFVKACSQSKQRGTSTCCICKIHNDNSIESLNFGDSGYIILRPYKHENDDILDFNIVFKSEEQTHGFNFPFQVGENGDNPLCAEVIVHAIQPYDIIVLASDGLWDNLSEKNIIKVFRHFLESKNKEKNETQNTLKIDDLEGVSKYITKTAEHMSLDKSYKSPFAIRSKGLYLGGKHDDITIVVAQILEQSAKF